MTQQPLIHPETPEFLSAAALYSAPIDLEAAVARIHALWNEDFETRWEEVPMGPDGAPGGRILRFTLEGVLVLVTPVDGALEPERGELPEHGFHVAITCYSPLEQVNMPHEKGGDGMAEEDAADESDGMAGGDAPADADGAPGDGTPDGEEPPASSDVEDDPNLPLDVRRRRRALAAHIVLTELADALMREETAIGLLRPELGVVQPPEMIVELADLLSEGQAPLPLWVNVRTQRPDLVHGRTLGLPLFGHLDLEVVESTRPEEDVYAMLANTADYLISSDVHLMPGQSIGYRDDELAITQDASFADGAPVLRIGF